MVGDKVGSVGTGDEIIASGRLTTVSRVVVHPPGQHVGSPIVGDMFGVEIVTPCGPRWCGGTRAWIGSDLRVHWER